MALEKTSDFFHVAGPVAQFAQPTILAGNNLVVLEDEAFKFFVASQIAHMEYSIKGHAPWIVPGDPFRLSHRLGRGS